MSAPSAAGCDYYAAMRGAVEKPGGVVTQLLGDGVKAVFGARAQGRGDGIACWAIVGGCCLPGRGLVTAGPP